MISALTALSKTLPVRGSRPLGTSAATLIASELLITSTALDIGSLSLPSTPVPRSASTITSESVIWRSDESSNTQILRLFKPTLIF